jgi:class 3 adenylate cyclase
VIRCPACGEENSERARFCQACATPLGEASAREERRVVSVLFVDLVGFTSKSEQLDPEDVRAMLTRYYERARAEIERFGGTVEKFIGDAVMAVFGAPIAHGDDAERAVRAAMAVRDSIADMDEADPLLELQIRAAVNTGEAIVALGARPETGVAMVAGDVVNTAARLQSNAPVDSVLVGQETYSSTRTVIEYPGLVDAIDGSCGTGDSSWMTSCTQRKAPRRPSRAPRAVSGATSGPGDVKVVPDGHHRRVGQDSLRGRAGDRGGDSGGSDGPV